MARADALKKAENGGVTIKAPRGNRSQWHANFKLDEFNSAARDLTVLQKDADASMRLRGMLVVGPAIAALMLTSRYRPSAKCALAACRRCSSSSRSILA